MIQVEYNQLIYLLNKDKRTAKIINNDSASGDIIIPRSITYQQKEFTITCIAENSFELSHKIRSIMFASDSELQAIEKFSFFRSSVKLIQIPSSVIKLKEGWCIRTPELNKVIIMPNNKRYKNYGEGIVIGKTDINSEEYDNLIFVNRNQKDIQIPDFIKRISPYAFSESQIEQIFIPNNVEEIQEGSFTGCTNLKYINISHNSKLNIICKGAFNSSNIQEFFMPSSVSIIERNAFNYCKKLRKVEIPTSSELQRIEEFAFFHTKLSNFFIPSKVTYISKHTFKKCPNLQIIEIDENANIQLNDIICFNYCENAYIMIPVQLSNYFRKHFID